MSGLCGWLDTGRRAEKHADAGAVLLAKMARPLARFDGCGIVMRCGDGSGAAIAAQDGAVHFYQYDGLMVALWGRAIWKGHGNDGDIAVALALAWRRDGPQLCAALAGPFALCILDERSDEALLAIDRGGAHAISYRVSEQGLHFASSADALMMHPAVDNQVDRQAIYNYLYFHMVPSPGSIYRGQKRLLPGQYLHYRAGKAVNGVYWSMHYDERRPASFTELKQEFHRTLDESVARAAGNASENVGAFLSGGTDSSTLAAVLGKVSGRPARTYSIGFDAPGYDESDYARIASRHFGTDHHELYVNADDVVAAIPRLAAAFDQPFGNASAVPALCCAAMAQADGVTCLLGGDGGDELFGGNDRYARQAVFSRYENLPAPLRQILIEPLLFGLTARLQPSLLRKARSYIEQAVLPLPARLETYNLLLHYGDDTVLEADFLAGIDTNFPSDSLNRHYWGGRCDSQINRLLALDLKFTLADNDLPKVNRACELAGVEVAFPFLDDAMVAFSARLPPWQKLNGTRLRYFFKRAMADVLPPAILRKKKHGFGLPFGVWLRQHTGLREMAYDSLSDLSRRHIVRSLFIDTLLSRHLDQHPAYHGTMVWVLMMLEQWFQQRGR
jgi:asparagine synthase (glutamine-hydrolysing)